MSNTIERVYGVVVVGNFDRARGFYTKVFARGPDREPMPGLAEWHLGGGGLQVLASERIPGKKGTPGQSYVTIAVSDLDAQRRQLESGGVPIGERQAGDTAGIAQLSDPDGNLITFAQQQA